MDGWIATLRDWLHPVVNYAADHTQQIALAIVATVLVLYGHDIEKHIKKHVEGYNFVIRTAMFICICAFGYGLVTVLVAEWLEQLLESVAGGDPLYLIPLVLVTFIGLGILAERKNFI